MRKNKLKRELNKRLSCSTFIVEKVFKTYKSCIDYENNKIYLISTITIVVFDKIKLTTNVLEMSLSTDKIPFIEILNRCICKIKQINKGSVN